MELVQVIKALGDETRLRILNLLKQEKLCVCELEYLLDINQSNASRHLNKLWTLKIITNEKIAQWVFYQINENLLEKYPFIREILRTNEAFARDNERLNDYKKSALNRENVKEIMCKSNS